MQKKRVVKAVLLVGVWAYAGSTWASIGHHLVGLPDVSPAAALACAVGAAAWTMRSARSATTERPTVRPKEPAAAR